MDIVKEDVKLVCVGEKDAEERWNEMEEGDWLGRQLEENVYNYNN